MTLLFIEEKPPVRRSKYPSKRILHLKCDVCNKEFQKSFEKKLSQQKYHSCSYKCRGEGLRSDGIFDLARRAINLEKIGVEYVFQTEKFKIDVRQIWMDKYGVDNPLKVQEWHDAGIYSASLPQCRASVRSTVREKYGYDCVSQVPEFKLKALISLNEKHGDDEHFYTNVSQIPYFKQFLNTEQALIKKLQTEKENNTQGTSKIENHFYEKLCQCFDDVFRFQRIPKKRWIIDFYIPSIDTYVQFDGVYWHGLNRPIEEIRKSLTKRDMQIAKAFQKDQAQNAWFQENGLRLVRVTDKEFQQQSFEKIIEKIKGSSK